MGESAPVNSRSAGSGTTERSPALTPARWQQIKELFSQALELDANHRTPFLQEACGADDYLRVEVESLLASADSHGADTSAVFKPVPPPGEHLPSEAEDPLIGRRIGDYRIDRQIGYGGMAAVYLASRADEQFQMQAAIKLLRPDLNHSELLDRFLKERQTLAALDHPNIVKLLDGGNTERGLPYLVMDYVEGQPIDEYCDDHNLSIQKRLQLFCTVCDTVEFAHQHRVIHRDLKPNNILITNDGAPKLLDFGIAKVIGPQDPAEVIITRTAARHLTPAYASPEQVRGERTAAATDVYSLGVVLYGLLTGHRPYLLKQRTPAAMERAICEQEPESPSTAVNRVETETRLDGTVITVTAETVSRTRESQPEKLRHSLKGDLDNIILKALQKDPQRRYRTVADFGQDIRRHLNHQPVQARPNTLIYRASKLVRRYRLEASVLGVLVLVLIGAVAFSARQRRQALEEARAELGGDRLPGRPSVAVLGFKNLSIRSETSWVSTALAEMLLSELAAGGKLRTIPAEDVAHMKMDLALPEPNSLASQTLNRVRRYLKSDYVVTGSYLDLGGAGSQQMRLDLRLQNAAIGDTLASITLSGTESDLPDLAARAGAALRDKLGAGEVPASETAKVKASQPSNLEALRLYSEGIEKLRNYDPVNGRRLLEQAAAADPDSALIHSALADAWGQQGNDPKAKEEADKALALASGLPREQSLAIQGEALRVTRQWVKDVEIYRTLFTFFPDNLTYGVGLVTALCGANKGAEAMEVVEELKNMPKPMGDDPAVDLAEARASETIPDFKREVAAATRAAEKARIQGIRGVQAEALFMLSRALLGLGEPEKGIVAAEQAKEIWAAQGDRYGVARAANNIGNAQDDLGKYEEAEQAYTESRNAFHELGNRWNEATELLNLGIIRLQRGDNEGARQLYTQSLATSRELGNLQKVAMVLAEIALLDMREHKLADAKTHLEESLSINRARGDELEIAADLNSLANLYLEQEDLSSAKTTLEDATARFRKIGDRNELATALGNLGEVHMNRGELGPAKKRMLEAVELFTATKNPNDRATMLLDLANLAVLGGDLPGARKNTEEAITTSQASGSGHGLARAELELTEVSLEEGNMQSAEALARKATAFFHQEKDEGAESDASLLLARVLRQEKRVAEAQTFLESARSLVSKYRNHEQNIYLSLEDGRMQAALGKDAEAAHVLSDALIEAKTVGFVPLQFEAQLAFGEVEMKSARSAGRKRLLSLEQDARHRGFLLVARKASAAQNSQPTP